MWKLHHPVEPGRAPPRPVVAVAALAVALILHGAVLSLFHRQVPPRQLIASPAMERALAACRRIADRRGQQACRLAVAERARQGAGLTMARR